MYIDVTEFGNRHFAHVFKHLSGPTNYRAAIGIQTLSPRPEAAKIGFQGNLPVGVERCQRAYRRVDCTHKRSPHMPFLCREHRQSAIRA